MSAEKIIADWKQKKFKPLYWLEGEEPFFIDEVVDYAEHKILGGNFIRVLKANEVK